MAEATPTARAPAAIAATLWPMRADLLMASLPTFGRPLRFRRSFAASWIGALTLATEADFIDKKKAQILTIAAYALAVSALWSMPAMGGAVSGDFCITAISGNDPGNGPAIDGARSGPRWRDAISQYLAGPRVLRRPGVGGEAWL